MRILVFLYIIFATPFSFVFSQALLIKTNGEKINCRVLKVGIKDVVFQKLFNPDSPEYVIKKSQIAYIQYPNGDKDVFHKKYKSTIEDTIPKHKGLSKKYNAVFLNLLGYSFYSSVNYEKRFWGSTKQNFVTLGIGVLPAIAFYNFNLSSTVNLGKNGNYVMLGFVYSFSFSKLKTFLSIPFLPFLGFRKETKNGVLLKIYVTPNMLPEYEKSDHIEKFITDYYSYTIPYIGASFGKTF